MWVWFCWLLFQSDCFFRFCFVFWWGSCCCVLFIFVESWDMICQVIETGVNRLLIWWLILISLETGMCFLFVVAVDTINFQFFLCLIFVSSLDLRLPYFRESLCLLALYLYLLLLCWSLCGNMWRKVIFIHFYSAHPFSVCVSGLWHHFLPLSPCSPTHTCYVYVYVCVFFFFVCVTSFRWGTRGRGD